MNKQNIIDKLNSFQYDKNEYWLITGSAMVMYGFKEKTSDIDMGCSSALANQLEADGYLHQVTENGHRWFKVGDDIEVFENWLFDESAFVDGYRVISVPGLIEMKRDLGRDKDMRDIEIIRKYTSTML